MSNQIAFFCFCDGWTMLVFWSVVHHNMRWFSPNQELERTRRVISPFCQTMAISTMALVLGPLDLHWPPKISIGGDPTLFRIESPLPIFQKMASKEKHTQRFQIFSHPRLVVSDIFSRMSTPCAKCFSEWWLTSIT